MEFNDYELFLIAVSDNSDLQYKFYDFMDTNASNCMTGAIYLENLDEEKLKKIMENIIKEGVKASGIQAN